MSSEAQALHPHSRDEGLFYCARFSGCVLFALLTMEFGFTIVLPNIAHDGLKRHLEGVEEELRPLVAQHLFKTNARLAPYTVKADGPETSTLNVEIADLPD